MKYKKLRSYKYQVWEKFSFELPKNFDILKARRGKYLKLSKTGLVTVDWGYRWDGASGPAIDTPNFMTPSCIHDALYQLIRDGYIAFENWRDADKYMLNECKARKMSWFRRSYVSAGLKLAGGKYAKSDLLDVV